MPNLGYGFPGETADDNGVSAHRDKGLSTSGGLPVIIGRDRGLSGVGNRVSRAIRVVGEASLADELKRDFEYPLGGVVLSLPLRASSFCSRLLSYACALLLRYLSWTELWNSDRKGSWCFDLLEPILVPERLAYPSSILG